MTVCTLVYLSDLGYITSEEHINMRSKDCVGILGGCSTECQKKDLKVIVDIVKKTLERSDV